MRELLVCRFDELQEGGVRLVRDGALEVGVFRSDGELYAYRNVCPHQGGPACEGIRQPQIVDVVDGEGFYRGQRYDESDMHIVCPWHGYEYKIKTGEHACDPNVRLQKFEVLSRDGDIYVLV
jgi:nitrite reductase (NADH) small subunit